MERIDIAVVLVCGATLVACGSDPQPPVDRVVPAADAGPRCFGAGVGAGSPCRCDSDCVAGRCMDATDRGERLCVVACLPGVIECAAGQACVGARPPDEPGVCFDECEGPDECATGQLCSTSNHCLPWCTRDEDCTTRRCDLHSGRCADFPAGALGVGEPCFEDRDCRSALCNGRCQTLCDARAPGCPDGAVCLGDMNGTGLCAPRCMATRDCPEGTVCDARESLLVCLPPAS